MAQKRALRLTPAQLTAKAETLFNVLEAHARNGKRCPSLYGLAAAAGIGTETVQNLLARLRKEKRIRWVIEWSQDAGPVRVVTIVKTGQQTQRPNAMARRSLAPQRPDQLALAKTVLRRSGAYVWDAAVDGGPRGFVRVDGEVLTPKDVIARAAAVQAQRRIHH